MIRKGISEEINLNCIWENEKDPAVQRPGEEGTAFLDSKERMCLDI